MLRFQGQLCDAAENCPTPAHTYTLITRLHHNVIKTAVKTISLAYSKITFADIAQKLLLDSPDDAEFIVAKAIRDGVIEAELDHEAGIMQSKDTSDVYSTRYSKPTNTTENTLK